MSLFQIPVQNIPQQFSISLADKNYTITCRWNSAEEAGWILDISDATNAVPIVSNVPLITGADILSGLGYLGFGGAMIVFTDADFKAPPTYTNLGTDSNLYFLTE